MTIKSNIELYKNGTARGALLPRVLKHLGISDADKDKLLTALWIDQKSEILKGDFIRLNATDAANYDCGEVPAEVQSLLGELDSAGL